MLLIFHLGSISQKKKGFLLSSVQKIVLALNHLVGALLAEIGFMIELSFLNVEAKPELGEQ